MYWAYTVFLRHFMIGFHIDGEYVAAIAVLYYWAFKPRATTVYVTAVVGAASLIAYFDSLLTWEPMPLMVDSFYRVDGICNTGLGTATGLIILSAASLVIYYDNEASLTAE